MNRLAERLRPVAPIALVTSFAVYGQFAWGLDHLPQHSLIPIWVIAGGAATAFESISLYVQWHAHDALLRKDTATAAWYRRWSYLLAAVAAAVNYSHFANGWAPTAGAVMFALFSLASPWLWGLHTRRAHHIQLRREGRIDDTGAVFSAERWRHFPIRTWHARRWSIDYGVTDPREAWEGHRTARAHRAGQPTAEEKVALLLAVSNLAAPRATAPALEQFEDVVVPDLSRVDDNGLSMWWRTAPKSATAPEAEPVRKPSRPAAAPPDVDLDRARALIAAGAGRVRLQNELGLSEHKAKQLVKTLSNGHAS